MFRPELAEDSSAPIASHSCETLETAGEQIPEAAKPQGFSDAEVDALIQSTRSVFKKPHAPTEPTEPQTSPPPPRHSTTWAARHEREALQFDYRNAEFQPGYDDAPSIGVVVAAMRREREQRVSDTLSASPPVPYRVKPGFAAEVQAKAGNW